MGNKSSSQSVDFSSTSSIVDEKGDENVERGNWSGKLDFILSCLGYAVGLGNVWRFPYLAYTYGGAIFLIPYALSLLLIGIPIFLMELSLGQFSSSGPLTCWKMAPAFQGLGAAMLVITAILGVYYNMIIGWSIYYMVASFVMVHKKQLPWSYCDRQWATPFCEDYLSLMGSALNCSMWSGYDNADGGGYAPFPNGLCIGMSSNASSFLQPFEGGFNASDAVGSFIFNNQTVEWAAVVSSTDYAVFQSNPVEDSPFTLGLVGIWNETLAKANGFKKEGKTEQYFYRRVLRFHKSSGLTDMGEIHWDLALCLLAGWIIVFLCLIKGIKSSGKVVYFTALFPYVVLVILLIRGALMDGAYEGVLYYIRGYGSIPPKEGPLEFYRSKLSDVAVWKAAAEQIFFSLSACYGGLIALASYNKFKTNVIRDTMIITFGNCLTSFFAGFVIFSFLGALALQLGVEVSEVTKSGIGLAFTVYPSAVTFIPPDFLAPLWSFLFFVMLLTLGLDSEFALMETLLTSICDIFPKVRPYKTPVIAGICSVFFLMGLSLCSSGGLYMLNLLDSFGAGWNVLIIAVLECICVGWVYGHRNSFTRFADDIQTMLGTDTVCCCIPWRAFRWIWMIMWMVVTPGICMVLTIYALVEYGGKPPLTLAGYQYETGFVVLGWLITALIATFIILGFVVAVMKNDGSFVDVFSPTRYWGPALTKHRQLCNHCPDMDMNPWSNSIEMRDSNDLGMSYHSSKRF